MLCSQHFANKEVQKGINDKKGKEIDKLVFTLNVSFFDDSAV